MDFLLYNIKVSICLIGFYLLYRLFLSRETFLRMNRIVLLSAIAISFILPRCGLTLEPSSHGVVSGMSLNILLDEIAVGSSAQVADSSQLPSLISWDRIVIGIYAFGVLFFAIRLLVSLFQIVRMLRGGDRVQLPDGVTLVLHTNGMSPFSWIHYVSMNRADYEQNGREILTHELAHIRYGHSFDLMAADIACCLLWFNPAMWLLRSELCAVHEFEADKAVLDSGVNAKQYQILLIKKAAGAKWSSVANSFNHSKLKNRITMMLRKESSVWARAKVLYVLPIIGGAMIAFANVACSSSEDMAKEFDLQEEPQGVVKDLTEALRERGILNYTIDKSEQGNQIVSYTSKDGKDAVYGERQNAYMFVGVMPEYPGGTDSLRSFLAKEVHYPEAAVKAQKEGRVFVRFVINEKGEPVEVAAARPIDPDLDEEAVRVVSSMPKWTPGKVDNEPVRVSYVVPINFKL